MSYYTLPFFEVQKAIYEKLSANTRLQELGVGVYDTPSENTPYPYVTIAEPSTLPIDTKTTNNEQMTFTIHVWRKDDEEYAGKKIVYEILSECLRSLMTRRYTISGIIVLDVLRVDAQVFDDIEIGLKHGVLRVRYKIQNKY